MQSSIHSYAWMTFSSVPIGETFESIGTPEYPPGLFVKVTEHHARPSGHTGGCHLHIKSPRQMRVRISVVGWLRPKVDS